MARFPFTHWQQSVRDRLPAFVGRTAFMDSGHRPMLVHIVAFEVDQEGWRAVLFNPVEPNGQ